MAICAAVAGWALPPGCASVYDSATDNLPADMFDRLMLRTRQTLEVARQAGSEVRLASSSPKNGEARGQRLESLGIELERRAASIGDVLARIDSPPEGAFETLAAFQEAAGWCSAAAGTVMRHEPAAAETLAAADRAMNAAISSAEDLLATKRPKGPHR